MRCYLLMYMNGSMCISSQPGGSGVWLFVNMLMSIALDLDPDLHLKVQSRTKIVTYHSKLWTLLSLLCVVPCLIVSSAKCVSIVPCLILFST